MCVIAMDNGLVIYLGIVQYNTYSGINLNTLRKYH